MLCIYTYLSLHVTTIFQTLGESDIHGIQSHTLHLCDYTATVPIHFVLEQSLLLLLFTIPLYIQMCRAGGPGWLLYTRHS